MGRKEIPIDPEEVRRLAAQGLNEAQISAALGFSWKTLNERKKKYAEFQDALKEGKAAGIAEVTGHLMNQAREGNTSATIFYLKNRDRDNWRDNWKEDSDTGETVVNINMTGVHRED